MTGTETFTVLSTEDQSKLQVVLPFGKMVMVDGYIVDGYIIENLLPIWGKGHLILIGMLGSTVSEQDNLSKKVR